MPWKYDYRICPFPFVSDEFSGCIFCGRADWIIGRSRWVFTFPPYQSLDDFVCEVTPSYKVMDLKRHLIRNVLEDVPGSADPCRVLIYARNGYVPRADELLWDIGIRPYPHPDCHFTCVLRNVRDTSCVCSYNRKHTV